MSEENPKWSKPDYAAWRKGVHEVSKLPPLRFYFAVTVSAMVAIAYCLIHEGAHWSSGFSIAVLILVFGATAFILQWRRDGNGQSKRSTTESEDQQE